MRQEEESNEVTEDLQQEREEVPEELVPSVEQLTTSLRAVQDPQTSTQERDGVIRIAQDVSSALEVVGDPETPRALRAQLAGLVHQVTSTLEAANTPGLQPEERRTVIWIAERSASALGVIGDRETPQELREQLAGTVKNVGSAVTRAANAHDAMVLENARPFGTAMATISDPNAPDEGRRELAQTTDDGRKELAQTTHEASSSLEEAGDPRLSDEERDEARKELEEQIDRMEKQLEEVASAQGLPDVQLGKAAEVCTNSLFDSVPDGTLTGNLKSLLPEEWNTEGVKDFWKSEEKGNDFLDVLTQLRNNEFADAPLEINRLIPKLADAVPASELFGITGSPALYCLRAAWQLDQDLGIRSGTWVKKAEEKM
ncbi:hypothetical protein GCM10010377_79200 [Streptomyces viridiviolaceus]|uniref:Uncharacterized protein n=1 Tax=Streptomyces viridiviolaceus TaxID=68282 RepID=A0ABW2E6B7_9ACTN|nr:hypothetical protein [Streptomyces viridiviolaceus]GHB77032.1 hypothetical protein GCM10010377_79200 [Streptomyces viridiviolaceus]